MTFCLLLAAGLLTVGPLLPPPLPWVWGTLFAGGGADEKPNPILWPAGEGAVPKKKGRPFGRLRAAGRLRGVPLRPRPRSGKFAGSVQGTLIGAPLGVCVNC